MDDTKNMNFVKKDDVSPSEFVWVYVCICVKKCLGARVNVSE